MTDEFLMAYVDGALSAEEARQMELALSADAALRARVTQQMRLRDALRGAFDPALSDAIPAALTHAAMTAPVSWRWRLREIVARGAMGWSGAFSLPRFAMTAAAALVIGLVIGRSMFDRGLIETDDGATVARGALAQSLETQLASESGSGVHVGVSFRSRSGGDCRTFSAGRTAGIACKADAGTWHIAALAESEDEGAGDFHAAGAAMPDAIRDQVGRMIDGEPFDAARERSARDAGWANGEP